MKNLIPKLLFLCSFIILNGFALAASPEIGPFRMHTRILHQNGIHATLGEGRAYYDWAVRSLNQDLETNEAFHELYYKIFSLRNRLKQVEDAISNEPSIPEVASFDKGLAFFRIHERTLNLLLATYALNSHYLLRGSADIAPFIKSIKLNEADGLQGRITYDKLLAEKFPNVKSNIAPTADDKLVPSTDPKPEDLFLRPTMWVSFILEMISSLNAAIDSSELSEMDASVPEASAIRDIAVKYLIFLSNDAVSPGADLIWKKHNEELLSIAKNNNQDITWSQNPPYTSDIGKTSSKVRYNILEEIESTFQLKEEEYLASRLCDQKCIDQVSTDPKIRAAQTRRDLLRKKKDLEIQLMIVELHLYNANRSMHSSADDYYGRYAGGRWWPQVIENFMEAKRASAWKAFSERSSK